MDQSRGPHAIDILRDPMALEWAAHDWIVEDDFRRDQAWFEAIVHNRMALVWADHDRIATDSSSILFSLDILWKQCFRVFEAYIALIDEPFITLDSWWCFEGIERLQERF